MNKKKNKKTQEQKNYEHFIASLIKEIKTKHLNKAALAKRKIRLSEQYKLKKIPSDIEILMSAPDEEYDLLKKYLSSKPTRNISGVHVVALMSKPHNCPHGTCIMCPGGLKSVFGDVPKSYTGNEPATMRAMRNHYDPYLQVFNRLEQYVLLGIYPQKIELILMGGTFLFLPQAYKEDFIRNIYKAMNDFSRLFYHRDGTFKIKKFKEFFLLPHDKEDTTREQTIQKKILLLKEKNKTKTLEEEQSYNDKYSFVKCVGLTIETKPDYGKAVHGNEMLRYGCTRVELGVQTLYEEGLQTMHRGHSLNDTEESIADLRDLGFKLNFHIMLGVPGITREQERKSLAWYFSDPRWKPDMVKIYPLMVMPGTVLAEWYKQGKYKPISTAEAAEMIVEFKRFVQPYCRIMRVQRDIPPKYSIDGVDRSNLRQYVEKTLREKNIQCHCIRCREIGHVLKQQKNKQQFLASLHPEILVYEYEAAHGEEFFISIEDPKAKVLFGFIRMRFPSRSLRKEITPETALIRELHVYGTTALLGEQRTSQKLTFQHKGFGKKLMKKAEQIAKAHGKRKMVVISGVGVRGYYRKLGYHLEGPYMVKWLKTTKKEKQKSSEKRL